MSTTILETSEIQLQPVTMTTAQLTISEDASARPDDTVNALRSGSITLPEPMSLVQASIIIITISSVPFIQSLLNGVLTVALPRIASDFSLPPGLLLWPASISNLVSGCTLLLAGSFTDVFSSRSMYLLGSCILCAFVLGSGLARTGTQFIVFRGLTGLALSLSLPSGVAITTASFERGKRRNLAFTCLGGAQPLGFSIGLVGGGALVDKIGWQYAFLIAPIGPALAVVLGWRNLPQSRSRISSGKVFLELASTIDWIGAGLATAALALLSYVLAVVTSNTSSIKKPTNISLLGVAFVLLVVFVAWQSLQEKKRRPVLIPNSLWRNMGFSSICAAVFLSWACFNANQYFITLYMQNIQRKTATQASVQFQPVVISSVLVNLVTGFVVPRVRAGVLVTISAAITITSPLLMTISKRQATYWMFLFPALAIEPVGADTLFTISNLVITQVFPVQTHGLAGGVFNTLAQLGMSVGLAVAALVSTSTSGDQTSVAELEVGYRAVFWLCTAVQGFIVLVAAAGLRKSGKVGLKQD